MEIAGLTISRAQELRGDDLWMQSLWMQSLWMQSGPGLIRVMLSTTGYWKSPMNDPYIIGSVCMICLIADEQLLLPS